MTSVADGKQRGIMNNTGSTFNEEDVGSSVDAQTISDKASDGQVTSSNAVTSAVGDVSEVDDVQESSTNIDVTEICSITSSSSSCCRICQLDGEGSNESLTTSRCSCRGYLAKVHHGCLAEWVRYRGSNLCEICNHTFLDIPAPRVQTVNLNHIRGHFGDIQLHPEQQEVVYYQALEFLRTQLPQFQLSRRKRTAIMASITFLFLITCIAAIFTLGASRDFQKINDNPWASLSDVRKNHVVFAITISFTFFCATLTLGLALMWLVLECFYYIKRRQILHHVAQRFLAYQQRRGGTGRVEAGVV